jgi:hypothetical protein
MDDFFLRIEQRTPERMTEVGGNVDYERFLETVLFPVSAKKVLSISRFPVEKRNQLKNNRR